MEVVNPEVVTLQLASWPRRVLSAVIDSFVISFISLPFMGDAAHRFYDAVTLGKDLSAADLRTITVVNLVVTVVYMTLLHGWRGSTLGKMAARTVVVNDDGSPITIQVAFVRSVTLAGIQFISSFLIAPIFVNELRPLWSPKRQTWHDVIAKTVVVRA